ncbi:MULTISPECIES: elongation factor P [spotted fever group]|uniref:Elongation factor P n=1 Tax=Rickettsia tamurae subsp. buchneri TaxID=1462938 RepID=A0A8E0WNE5_9RICK|nr:MULTISPECIES: elongation factor P [spotted fever group]EER22123.1 translation elongation factor P [Rickettsia endosymbiont of Ixodes scapularis]KDO03462.1 Elongation factor P [Rickettsia tamurae subsp. buchneri]
MKISANSIRTGNILVYNNDLWVVSKIPEHTQPGKGGAYVQVEMKNLKTGTKRNERFSSSNYLEKAELEQKDYQFLYFEGDDLVLMDTKHFDQINVPKEILEEKLPFLTENMIVKVEFYNEKPLNIELPPTVILEISETDPVIKGATATASYKPAILENGIKVKVPQYLEIGEKIVVKTDDITYVERAK